MNMFSKLKQFKDLKSKAKNIQNILSQESVEGSAGWGKVKIQMNGNQLVTAVMIEPDAMKDKTKLQDMVKDAVNDAVQKVQKVMSTKLKEVGGLDLAAEFGEAIKK